MCVYLCAQAHVCQLGSQGEAVRDLSFSPPLPPGTCLFHVVLAQVTLTPVPATPAADPQAKPQRCGWPGDCLSVVYKDIRFRRTQKETTARLHLPSHASEEKGPLALSPVSSGSYFLLSKSCACANVT